MALVLGNKETHYLLFFLTLFFYVRYDVARVFLAVVAFHCLVIAIEQPRLDYFGASCYAEVA